jgi:hypothetical protein
MDFENRSALRRIKDALGPGRRVPGLDLTERILTRAGLPMPDDSLEEASS